VSHGWRELRVRRDFMYTRRCLLISQIPPATSENNSFSFRNDSEGEFDLVSMMMSHSEATNVAIDSNGECMVIPHMHGNQIQSSGSDMEKKT
jgi:hypothetical protein